MNNDILQHFNKSEHDFVRKVVNWKESCLNNSKVQLTYFLTPREQDIVKNIIGTNSEIKVCFDERYLNHERKRCIIAPKDFNINEKAFKIEQIKVSYNNKFLQLKHSDCLGAIMALGVDRFHFGDIVEIDTNFIIFLSSEIVQFVIDNLTSIGKAKITLTIIDNYDIINTYESQTKSIIVSSMRLDSILARIFNLSRNNAKEYIMAGLVKVNHIDSLNPNQLIHENDLISLRRFGRCKVSCIKGKTKKDKIMIEVSM